MTPIETSSRILTGAVVILALAGSVAETSAQEWTASASRRRPVTRPELPLPPEVVRDIDAVAADALSKGLPGMEVGVQIGDDAPFLRGYGFSNLEDRIRVHANDVFQVGSITKQFVAALIMRRVETGQIDLNDSITDYVPELNTRGYRVTIRQLLTHTAGAPNYTNYLTDLETPMTQQQIINLVNQQAWDFPPGTNWSYSNTGYYLAGMVLERVTGESFVTILNNEIILPLGLTRTSYCGTVPGQPVPQGYMRSPGVPLQPAPSWDPDLGWAAGALCSTTGDLLRWVRALSGGEVVSPASWSEMTTKVELTSGLFYDYGYGLSVTSYAGKQLIAHGGAVPGFLCFLAWYPEYDLSVAVLTNLYALYDYSSRSALQIGEIVAASIDSPKRVPAAQGPAWVPSGPLDPGTGIPRPNQ